MRALLALLAAAALAGCSVPVPGGEGVLLVHARDMVAVHGDGDDTVLGAFGPHCRHAVLEDEGRRLTLRFELAEGPLPRALLVRSFELHTNGASVPTVSADMTGHHALGADAAAVPAPFEDGPKLMDAWLEGDAVRLGDQTLQPGQDTSISFSYTVRGDANATLDVEETLIARHLGHVPAKVEKGLGCA